MDEKIDLKRKFPGMKPVTQAPSLSTLNGVGTCVYGKRDVDYDTGTYVKTHVFVIFFIPIIAMGAYRVADAPGSGWYFLGKVPLSFIASAWNKLMLTCILASVGGLGFSVYWTHHTSSPEYKAEKKLEDAQELEKEGRYTQALSTYYGHLRNNLPYADRAKQGLASVVETILKGDDLSAICKTYEILLKLNTLKPPVSPRPELMAEVEILFKRLAHNDPVLGSAFLGTVKAHWADKSSWDAANFTMLLARIAESSKDLEAADALAMIYEGQKDLKSCKTLLEPVRNLLGSRESARVLGKIYMSEGNFTDAYAMLNPYVSGRLEMLKHAEDNAKKAYEKASDAALSALNQSPDSAAYKRLSSLPKKTQGIEVEKYLSERAVRNPGYKRAMAELEKMIGIVGVAMDLGFLQLTRAKSFPDPIKRKAELEAAEKTFLAVRGVAGGTDDYNLTLGQVYYWLGKEADGHALLDEVATKNQGNCRGLFPVVRTLREIGERPRALAMAETAYDCAKTDEDKSSAASLCAAMATDTDKKIDWLKKVPHKANHVLAQLAEAEGDRAAQNSDLGEAERQYRKALGFFAKLPKNATTLNNCSLCQFALFNVTGDVAVFNDGVSMLEKAAQLESGNSILLTNFLDCLSKSMMLEFVKDKIDLKLTRFDGDLDAIDHFYDDAKGRAAFLKKLTTGSTFEKSQKSLDRLFILSPKSLNPYTHALTLYALTEDVEKLEALNDQLVAATLDLSELSHAILDGFQPPQPDETKKSLEALAKTEVRVMTALEACDRTSQAVSFSLLCEDLIDCRLAQLKAGKLIDLDKLVTVATTMNTVNPCANARGKLMASLIIRGLARVAKTDQTVATFVKENRRLLNTQDLLAVLMDDATRAKRLAADPDIERSMDLFLSSRAKFPDTGSASVWIILRHVRPKDAARIRTAALASRLDLALIKISRNLSPLSMSVVLQDYWRARAEEKPGRATKILATARSKGVPVPSLLK